MYYPYQTINNVEVASFYDGARDALLKELEVAIMYARAGSGTPSPDNVRAISGWTGANIFKTGINVWDEATESGTISATGEDTSSTTSVRSKNHTVVSPSTDYLLVMPVGTSVRWCAYRVDGTFIQRSNAITVPTIITTQADCASVRLVIGESTYGNDVTLNYPATKYSISFPADAGVIYGGTLTDNGDGTWTLLKTHGSALIKDLDWKRGVIPNTELYRFYVTIEGKANGITNIICDSLQTSDAADITDIEDNSIRGAGASANVSIRADTFDSVNALKDITSGLGNSVIVYELATPQTYTITAASVTTLHGDNNIFADTGEIIKLTYQIDRYYYYRRIFMINSGYVLVDAKELDLSDSTSQSISGIYKSVTAAIDTGKPIFMYNIINGSGVDTTPVPVFAYYSGASEVTVIAAIYSIAITSADACTVSEYSPT